MDGFEIVAPAASDEAIFSRFTLKWLSAFKMDKMVIKGRLSIHLQKALKLSKAWGEGHFFSPTAKEFVRYLKDIQCFSHCVVNDGATPMIRAGDISFAEDMISPLFVAFYVGPGITIIF